MGKRMKQPCISAVWVAFIVVGAFGWWKPAPFDGLTWQWQIGSVPDTNDLLDVDMYDVDLFDTPEAVITAMKNRGIVVTCYFSAGTYEGWRPDWETNFSFITGDSYTGNEAPFLGKMSDWDERWLDIRRIDLLESIMRSRMQLAKQKGCDCVEPDNMDSYTNPSEVNPTGSYTAAHQLAYNHAIAKWAHDESLSVALKNDLDQLDSLVDDYDWALNEQCFEYEECDIYQTFINAGKAVFGVEYSGDTSDFCDKAYEYGYSWLKKLLGLTDWLEPCPVKDTITQAAIRRDNHARNHPINVNYQPGSATEFTLTGRQIRGTNQYKGLYVVLRPDGTIVRRVR